MKVIRAVTALVREVQCWRHRHAFPQLSVRFTRSPYWGGVKIPLEVSNTGALPVHGCRYCRRQDFLMDPGGGSASPVAEVWYASDTFDVPAGGACTSVTAYATTDSCPRVALADFPVTAAGERVEAAIVCRDRLGRLHRFRLAVEGTAHVDTWRDSPLGRLLGHHQPEWAAWESLPPRVEHREWTAKFAPPTPRAGSAVAPRA